MGKKPGHIDREKCTFQHTTGSLNIVCPFLRIILTPNSWLSPVSVRVQHVGQGLYLVAEPRCTRLGRVSPSSNGCALCYTEKATPARHRPERQHNARSNRRNQCSPNETKPYSNPTPPRKRQNTPTNGHTPRRMKPTHTRLTYTRMRPDAPSHQAGDHPVPVHTERHNPPKVRTQRQS